MRSFTDIFVRRPVLASVVSLLILLGGLQAFYKLQIRQFPELSSTTITITTIYPGANADLIKGLSRRRSNRRWRAPRASTR